MIIKTQKYQITSKKKAAGMKKNNVTLIILAAVMILIIAVISGCSEIKITRSLGADTFLEIEDARCSMGTATLALLEAKDDYDSSENDVLWIRTIGQMTLAEYVQATVKDELTRYTAAQVMATDLTVFITEDERSKAENDARDLLNGLGSKFNMNKYRISLDDAVDLFLKRTYYEKVYDKISENINMEISEEDTKVIEISYVFIPVEDGISVAEVMRNEMKGGADFTTVCYSFGYEPVLNAKMSDKGTMPVAFENYAYVLKDNELSEIVETKDGYYIILCLEDYLVSESVANRNRIMSDGRREKFNAAYDKFADEHNIRTNYEQWNKLDITTME